MKIEKMYKNWRVFQKELGANWDCGEQNVREDFTRWANLETEISFEDMLKLERGYR